MGGVFSTTKPHGESVQATVLTASGLVGAVKPQFLFDLVLGEGGRWEARNSRFLRHGEVILLLGDQLPCCTEEGVKSTYWKLVLCQDGHLGWMLFDLQEEIDGVFNIYFEAAAR